MLKESLIENHSIALNQTAASWQEAIKIGTHLLVKAGTIEPYIILAPGLAMPHARPEEGVIKASFALVTLKEPVTFEGEDEPVSVFIILAGSDSDRHMEGLMEITQVLDDEESETGVNLDKVLACKTAEDVYVMIDAALNA